jgi:hypothetical protein
MATLPTPIRATLGLLATALDAVQELVEHAPEIPMEAVGNSMQLSMRLQQHYVAMLTRGDEFIASLRGAPEEPPPWATFDEPPSSPGGDGDRPDGAGLLDLDLGGAVDDAVEDLPEAQVQDGARNANHGDPLLSSAMKAHEAAAPGRTSPAKKAPARKAAAKKAATKAAAEAPTVVATDTADVLASAVKAAATKAPAKRTAAKKTAAKKSPAEEAAATKSPAATAPAAGTPADEKPRARRGRPPGKAGPRKAASAEAVAGTVADGSAVAADGTPPSASATS